MWALFIMMMVIIFLIPVGDELLSLTWRDVVHGTPVVLKHLAMIFLWLSILMVFSVFLT